MPIEKGVMVMKKGKAWGTVYQDAQCESRGWIDPIYAPIHNPKFCKVPTDITYKNSPDEKELIDAELVHVERITEITLIINTKDMQ